MYTILRKTFYTLFHNKSTKFRLYFTCKTYINFD